MGVIAVDCLACGAREWSAEEREDSYKFTCSNCNVPSVIHTGGRGMAYDCDMCGGKEWTVTDQQEEQIKFRCDECGEYVLYELSN